MGIKLIMGCSRKSIFGIVCSLFWDVFKGLVGMCKTVQDVGGWIKSGKRKGSRWIGKKQVWEKRG